MGKTTMEINSAFTFSKVRFDIENKNHLVVSLKAPKLSWQKKRPPIAIIPVVDVSGSMAGDKMEYTKKTLLKLIEHLQPGDYCGLVTFTSHVDVVSPLIEMTQSTKEKLKLAVGQLGPQGSTDYTGGMLTGLDIANKSDLPKETILRVIMFTDGEANQGISDPAGIKKALESNLGRATLSAFGYGSDAKQDLLADCAKIGKGNYAFVKNPDDALTAFGKELGGLTSVYAQNIVVELAPHSGHEISSVLSDVDVEEEDKKVKIKFPEILAEEVRNLVIETKLGIQPKAFPRDTSIVDVVVEYDMINEDGKREHRKEDLKAKVQFVKDGEQQAKADEDLDKIVALAQLVQSQIQAEDLANKGQFAQAQAVLNFMAADFGARGMTTYSAQVSNLGSKMANQAVYAASSGYLRSAKGIASRSYGISSADEVALRDVEACVGGAINFCNADQQSTCDSFTASESTGESPVVDPAVSLSSAIAPSVVVTPFPENPKEEAKSSVSKSKSSRW